MYLFLEFQTKSKNPEIFEVLAVKINQKVKPDNKNLGNIYIARISALINNTINGNIIVLKGQKHYRYLKIIPSLCGFASNFESI